MKMSKARFLFTLALAIFLVALLQAASGFILWHVLPGGGNGAGGGRGIAEAFGWDRHTWIDIHDGAAIALLVLIAVHIYMHRKWIFHQFKSLL